jgi:hypothetical protein
MNNEIFIFIKDLKMYCLDEYNYYSIKPDSVTFRKFIIDEEECGTVFRFSHEGLAIELIIDYMKLGQLNTSSSLYFKKELMKTAEKLICACELKKIRS